MRNLPTQEALVAAYWRKLANSIGAVYSGRGRLSVRRAARTLRIRRRRASRRPSGGNGAAPTALGPHSQLGSNS
jgi:hypothetical protein